MPAPPYSSGIGAPRKPCSPMRRKTSRCTSPRASQSRIPGRISVVANSRADCWTRRFSGESERSTGTPRKVQRPRFWHPALAGAGLLLLVEELHDVVQAEATVAALAHPVERQLAAVA